MNSHADSPDSDIAETSIFTASSMPCGLRGTPAERDGVPPAFAMPSLPLAHFLASTAGCAVTMSRRCPCQGPVSTPRKNSL